jgi:(p)ppGpp synthase/HD superfamily hydrolase
MNEKIKQEPKWQPTEKFFEAFELACKGHALDTRKGSDIPYIGHLLGVASAVIEAGGSEEQAMGAFLHDLVEDTYTTVAEIQDCFGEDVAHIVADCTDATKVEKDKEKELQKDLAHAEYCKKWWERKSQYLENLKKKNSEDSSVLVALADKTYNAENTAADLRGKSKEAQTEVWSKFNVGVDLQREWYLGLKNAFSQNKTYDKYSQPLHNRFVAAVEEMFPSTQEQ